MKELEYTRPTTVSEALALLALDGARPLSGGTDLIPQLREGRRQSGRIVDLKFIPELIAIERQPDGGWRVGAAVSIRALRRHQQFYAAHRELVEAGEMIGSLQVQSRASLGGNLCNAAPSGDGVPLLFALDAVAEVHGRDGVRHIAAETVPAGPGRTTLAPSEMLVSLHLPPRAERSACRYLRFTPRREMDIAVAGSGVRIDLNEHGVISAARVVLASVGPTPIRAIRAEAILVGAKPTAKVFEEAGATAAMESAPISDTRGSAEYRRDLVAVLTRRALADCATRIGAGPT